MFFNTFETGLPGFINEPPVGRSGPELLSRLTGRELEILRLSAKGLKTQEIARLLFVSENTVKFHRKNILFKLEAASMIEALAVLWR